MFTRPQLPPLKSFNAGVLVAVAISFLLFLFLSYTEFTTNHTSLITPPNPPLITIIKPIPTATSTPQISWRISAPSVSDVVTTSIYYGEVSSPSALFTSVAPKDAVYPNHTPDYLLGSFPLPATFVATLSLSPHTTYYYRAYTFINKQHYWTPQFTLTTD